MNELGITSSVRSLDLDVSLDYLNANVGGRCRCYSNGNDGDHREGCKVAPCDVSGMRLIARLVFLVVCHIFLAKSLSHFAGRPHRRIIRDIRAIRALGAVRSLAFPGGVCRFSSFQRESRPLRAKNREEPGRLVIPEIVTRFNCLIAVGQTAIRCRRLYLPLESLPDPSRWALVSYTEVGCRDGGLRAWEDECIRPDVLRARYLPPAGCHRLSHTPSQAV